MKMVQHHEKYLEIHGEDKIIWMTWSKHQKLHAALRRENKCRISSAILSKIAIKAHERLRQYVCFYETIGDNTLLCERIEYHPIDGTVSFVSRFKLNNKEKKFNCLPVI